MVGNLNFYDDTDQVAATLWCTPYYVGGFRAVPSCFPKKKVSLSSALREHVDPASPSWLHLGLVVQCLFSRGKFMFEKLKYVLFSCSKINRCP